MISSTHSFEGRSFNLRDPKSIYQTFKGHPLVGVYNAETKEIFLMPCIKDKV